MDKKRARTKEIDEADAVSATEMTGLISALPKSAAEEDNYADIMQYKAKVKSKNGKQTE